MNSQRKFDSQLLIAQQSAGQQIDNKVDKTLAGLDAKVKSIIRDTVKSQSIKKESLYFDPSLLECELTSDANIQSSQNFWNTSHPISTAFKRNRQTEHRHKDEVRNCGKIQFHVAKIEGERHEPWWKERAQKHMLWICTIGI